MHKLKFLTILWLIIGVVMCTLLFRSIDHAMKADKFSDYDKALIIGRLDTLKALQLAYNAVNGTYASDFNALSKFAVQAHLLSLSPEGNDQSNSPEGQAVFGGDYTSEMMQHLAFADKAKQHPFVFEVNVVVHDQDTQFVYEISTPEEMGEDRVLKIGNKDSKHIDGSWR